MLTFLIVLCMVLPVFFVLWARHHFNVSVSRDIERQDAKASKKWRDDFLNIRDFRK